jgi:hypothetical protein
MFLYIFMFVSNIIELIVFILLQFWPEFFCERHHKFGIFTPHKSLVHGDPGQVPHG